MSRRHRMRGARLATALVVVVAVGGCALPAEDAPTLDDVPPELGAVEAPPDTRIANVHTVRLAVDVAAHEPVGQLVYLKISANEVGQVFSGRVQPGATAHTVFSLPRASEVVTYELYDETGWRVVREAPVAPLGR